MGPLLSAFCPTLLTPLTQAVSVAPCQRTTSCSIRVSNRKRQEHSSRVHTATDPAKAHKATDPAKEDRATDSAEAHNATDPDKVHKATETSFCVTASSVYIVRASSQIRKNVSADRCLLSDVCCQNRVGPRIDRPCPFPSYDSALVTYGHRWTDHFGQQ